MWRKISLKVKITLLVSLLVALGVGFVIRLGLSKIQYVLDATMGAQVQTAAVTIASQIDPAWLREPDAAAAGAHLQARLRLVRELVTNPALGITEVQIIRYLNGRTAEYVFTSLSPTDPNYIKPGTRENILDSPVLFSGTPGYFGLENPDRQAFYMGGWAPVFSAPKRQEGLVLVLINADEIIRVLSQMNMFLWGVAGSFTLLAGVASWKVGSTFEKIAVTDGLMGIANQKHFKQQLEVECNRAGRYGLPLSLVMVDIDHFKKVNDTYGHAVGDQVLKHLGKWCLGTCRKTDLVARYGGEEIAILLANTALSGAQELAERLRLRVANEWVRDTDEEVTLRITVSVGVAEFERGMTAMDLVRRADAMLYQSKRNGRNRVTCWTYDYAGDNPPNALAQPGPHRG